jgi:hypothetical protein
MSPVDASEPGIPSIHQGSLSYKTGKRGSAWIMVSSLGGCRPEGRDNPHLRGQEFHDRDGFAGTGFINTFRRELSVSYDSVANGRYTRAEVQIDARLGPGFRGLIARCAPTPGSF